MSLGRTSRAGETFSRFASIGALNCSRRAEHLRWVSESLRPFAIAKDRDYRRLMKSGRPSAYISSPTTIARDVKLLFNKTRGRLKKRFQVYKSSTFTLNTHMCSPRTRRHVSVLRLMRGLHQTILSRAIGRKTASGLTVCWILWRSQRSSSSS